MDGAGPVQLMIQSNVMGLGVELPRSRMSMVTSLAVPTTRWTLAVILWSTPRRINSSIRSAICGAMRWR
ncbi:hypothetical protein SYNGFB01_03545 [Synechococcus sp. GFB01]|nr:hypothetical protein SYNGFB01_03545 [Synechococcus sp. GFB01]